MCIYDIYGPCSCPHGRCFTVLAQCFTIGSWIASMVAVTSCFYAYVRPIPAEGEIELPREGFGFLSRQAEIQEPPSYSDCVWWESEELDQFDAMWRAGKAMGILAAGIGFVVMCIVLCTCCVAYQLPTFDGLFWTCMFCFVAQCLTFLSWGSEICDDMECTWAPGSGTNISAAMLWLWAANMIKSFPEALPPKGRGRRGAIYEDDDDYYDDSPYLNPNQGFDDEYDYDGEEDDWQPDQEYYGGDDDYYDDGYDDEQDDRDYYPEEQPQHEQLDRDYSVDDQDDSYMQDEYASTNDQYSTDYEEPEAIEGGRPRQAADDDFEPNQHFRDTWSTSDNETFDESSDGNYFHESGTESSARAELSQEELEFLGDDTTSRSIEDLD